MNILLTVVLFKMFLHLGTSYEVTLHKKDSQECKLQWLINYDSQSVRFSLHIPFQEISNKRSIGFGFSESGLVYNADVIQIFATGSEVELKDCWTDKNGFLHHDQQQDYKVLSFERQHENAVITFERVFETCDHHDNKFHNETTNLITIFNLPLFERENEDTESNERINLNNYVSTHTFIQLLKPKNFEINNDGNYMTFDITAQDVIVPNSATTYWCSIHMLPDYASEIHGIGFEAIISESSKSLIHHIEVFGCDINDGNISSYNNICELPDQPEELTRCGHVLAAWAYGAKTTFYPKEAGLTFVSSLKSRYVRLEIHYNNPTRKESIVDRSGIRFYYSTDIRSYDVGILEVGVIYTPNMAIPPNQTGFIWPGICSSECTETALPPTGINVFMSEMHAHLAGRKIKTSHFRGNSQLPDINRDDYYSTWFEEIRQISPTQKILPGDMLVTFCEFNTEQRRQVTLGGLGINDEMCVNYLHYYPATDLEVCKSSVAESSLKAYLALENLEATILGNKKSMLQKIDRYDEIKWDKISSQELQFLYLHAPSNIHCLKPNRNKWGGEWSGVSHVSMSNFTNQQDSDHCETSVDPAEV